MSDAVLRMWIWQRATRAWLVQRAVPDDSGEGVISAAIAVLVMAFLGVALWVAFKATLGHATTSVDTQVTKIGQ